MRKSVALFFASIFLFASMPLVPGVSAATMTANAARRASLRLHPKMVSSSSKSSVQMSLGNQEFMPFLQRYVTVPSEWSVTIGTSSASFERMTDGRKGGSFSVEQIDVKQCDVGKIQEEYRKRMNLKLDDKDLPVTYIRIGGLLWAGLTWLDGTTPGGSRHWCIVPTNRIHVSHIRADDGEGDTKKFVEGSMLRDLAKDTRRSR